MKPIQLIDYYREIQNDAANDILKSTCQFLTAKDGATVPFASGVFIRVGDNYFLISAAHVMEDNHDELYVPAENNDSIRLGGELNINSIPSTLSRDDDQIDIAILKLDEISIEFVSNYYSFIDLDEVEISHSTRQVPQYISLGYPCTQTKMKYGTNNLISKPFKYITMPATNEIYVQLECNPYRNIVVHYDKKRVLNYSTGKFKTGPDAYGISGSGLWYIPLQIVKKGQKVEKKLVGIMIEWPKKNRKFWIATRIDIITEIIRKKYNSEILQSKIIRVNI